MQRRRAGTDQLGGGGVLITQYLQPLSLTFDPGVTQKVSALSPRVQFAAL